MSGTAKWLIVGSVVVMALATLIALGLFIWMIFGSPMMGSANSSWGTLDMGRMGETQASPWNGGSGMMDGSSEMMGNFGVGMMGGHGFSSFDYGDSISNEPLTIEAVEARLKDFLENRDDLNVGEIMIFDNHAYAQVIERETGIGAMEVLVDTYTLSVTPEYGPNMMWNSKYGMHGGGMMGFARSGDRGELSVSEVEAIAFAQAHLDRYYPDLSADEHADPFYGYYTIHTLREGEVMGMLSVNGFSGDVFPHTWHGTFLEMSESDHD